MTNILISIALFGVGAAAFVSGAVLLDHSLDQAVEQHIRTYIV